jgi:shikimate kinase
MKRPIALVGLSGVGKSTIASALAIRLGWPTYDIDAMLVQATGRTVAHLFAEEGEDAFREREAAMLAAALVNNELAVIATGGGIVLREANRQLLRERTAVIWLDSPDEEIIARLQASAEERPLLADDPARRIAAMRLAREPLYTALADLYMNTGQRSIEAIITEIIERMCYNMEMGRGCT